MICHIDIESFAWVDLKKAGVYAYSEALGTEILCLCFAFGLGRIVLWIPIDPSPVLQWVVEDRFADDDRVDYVHWGKQPPSEIVQHAESGGQFAAFNAMFERVMLNGQPGKAINFPPTKREQWVCTMVQCAQAGIPQKLETAAKALGCNHQKDETGKTIMQQLMKPRRKQGCLRWSPEADTDKYLQLYSYCIDDVETERDVDSRVPKLPQREQELYWLDQLINDRGFQLDLDITQRMTEVRDEYKARLAAKSVELCGFRPTQTEKLNIWINERYKIPNLQAQTIADAIADPKIPRDVKQVLRIRRMHEMKAPAKLDSMMRAVAEDDRLHGMFRYYGANTGRWSSVIVQLQNLFRSIIEDPDNAITLMREGLDALAMFYDDKDPMQVIASCMRGCLVAAPGKDLMCMDYSAIEGRVTAWLADDDEKLQVYSTHGKVYEATAAKLFGLADDLQSLKAMKELHPDERFMGKTCELALGFQGGWRALVKAAKKEGRVLEEDYARENVYAWRDINQPNVQLWYNLEDAMRAAIREPGSYMKTNKVIFHVPVEDGKWLKAGWCYMQLPSRRKLAYYKPSVSSDGTITYLGINTKTRQWGKVETFGGRLTENAAQATARDVLAHAMPKLDAAGYPLIGTVHDEVIAEVESGTGCLDEMAAIMCDLPEWAEGLPVRAEGWRGHRYKKD